MKIHAISVVNRAKQCGVVVVSVLDGYETTAMTER